MKLMNILVNYKKVGNELISKNFCKLKVTYILIKNKIQTWLKIWNKLLMISIRLQRFFMKKPHQIKLFKKRDWITKQISINYTQQFRILFSQTDFQQRSQTMRRMELISIIKVLEQIFIFQDIKYQAYCIAKQFQWIQ